MDKTTLEGQHRPDLFVFTLNNLNGGKAEQASNELAAVIEAVRMTERQGSVTVTLSVKPEGDGVVSIKPEIKAKPPKPDEPKTILFTTPQNNLQRTDPTQGGLELKTVEGLDIDPITGEILQAGEAK